MKTSRSQCSTDRESFTSPCRRPACRARAARSHRRSFIKRSIQRLAHTDLIKKVRGDRGGRQRDSAVEKNMPSLGFFSFWSYNKVQSQLQSLQCFWVLGLGSDQSLTIYKCRTFGAKEQCSIKEWMVIWAAYNAWEMAQTWICVCMVLIFFFDEHQCASGTNFLPGIGG